MKKILTLFATLTLVGCSGAKFKVGDLVLYKDGFYRGCTVLVITYYPGVIGGNYGGQLHCPEKNGGHVYNYNFIVDKFVLEQDGEVVNNE